MGLRTKLPLPFGGGLDRYSGTAVAESAAYRDLRNVHLRQGGAELRGGLGLVNDLAHDAIVGIFPIRSEGIGAVITYDTVTRDVTLYLSSADGTVVSLVGVVWTLAADNAFPRVLAADFNDRLVIAHDEPIYSKRRVTRVYDPGAGTIVNLQADLYLPTVPPTPVDVFFRGVMTYLNYLVGWGYGSENAGDDNRAEVVRISKPGELIFLPEHYFIAGTRGDPVLRCAEAGQVLTVSKPSSRAVIEGYDRATFGIRPLDRFFGILASRLSVTVGGVEYFWSGEGPRRSVGGLSEDLGLPLDLGGPAPSELATLTDPTYGFACYRPDRREVEFVFGKWAYVYHLGEVGAERWSYRPYAVELASAGVLYESDGGGASAIGTAAFPTLDSLVIGAPAGDVSLLTANYTTVGGLTGGEQIELWAKSRYAGDLWVRIATAAANPVGGAIAANVARFGITYDVAVRFTLVGIPGSGYTSSNPLDWPVASRAIGTTQVPAPVINEGFFGAAPAWSRVSGVAHGFTFQRDGTATPALHPELLSIFEHSTDGGGSWTAHAGAALAANPTQLDLANGDSSRLINWRTKDVSTEGVASAYFTLANSYWAGPPNLANLTLDDPATGPMHFHVAWTGADWPAGADANWSVGVVIHSYTPGTNSSAEGFTAYPATDLFIDAGGCGYNFVEAIYRTRWTQFGASDYSPTATSNVLPGNC